MNTKNIIIATLLVTNLSGVAMEVHYKHKAKEAQQNFDQAIGEQEQMQAEFDADKKEGCQDEVEFLRDEISEQAAMLRKLMPKRFKGEQASSYFVRLKKMPENLPQVVDCTSDGDCCEKNPERCAADNFRPY